MKKKIKELEGPTRDFITLLDTVGNTAYTLKSEAKRILDVGCGGGFLAQRLIETYPEADFTLLDTQEQMLKSNKAKTEGLTRTTISFVKSDMRFAEFQESSFDLIVALMSIHFMKSPEEYLLTFSNFRKWLSPKGIFVTGGFVGEPNAKIRNMQFKEWRKNQNDVERQRYPKSMFRSEMEFISTVLPVTEQIEMLKTAGFKNVGLLYKRFHFGAYYAIK